MDRIAPEGLTFPPGRADALARLSRFLPRAGRDYAAGRNYDLPEEGHPHVSGLSPYLRHRLILEEEVLRAVTARWAPSTAEKFLQEVVWRTYWKGWLEMRPGVWAGYREGLDRALADLSDEDAGRVAAAEAGETGIDAFDAWMQELRRTGYLHNHARMWAASIWIFTLGLPWQIGADHFIRHLLDGDPASNTLGWRWVAGLQTRGKPYVARSSNISKFTRGRHNPEWRLNTQVTPLEGPAPPAPRPAPADELPDPGLPSVLVRTEDDLGPDLPGLDAGSGALDGHSAEPCIAIAGTAILLSHAGRSPRGVSDGVDAFTRAAAADAMTRAQGDLGPVTNRVEAILDWAERLGAAQIVAPRASIGPGASAQRRLRKAAAARGISLVRRVRPYDAAAWPHATHGFFRFKGVIPDLLSEIGAG